MPNLCKKEEGNEKKKYTDLGSLIETGPEICY